MKKLNANLINLINILKDGEYHDGNTIGKHLRTSRSAIWKSIKKLQNYGVQIDSIKGKGYALREPLVLLEKNKIQSQLKNENIEIIIFESVHSTNEYLKVLKNSKKIIICLAEQQTQGKGRLSRTWYSPFGKNLYLSCYCPIQKDISELAGLSLVVSLAIVKTLNAYGKDNCFSAKWPNDVLYEGKKISGSLIEIHAESHGSSHAIIGIGINVNMLDDSKQINQAWSSLQQVIGEYIDRNQLCARLINNIVYYLEEFSSFGFVPFQNEWIKADCLTNQNITLRHADKKINGKVKGVNMQGHLLMELKNGDLRTFSSGDTTIEKK